MSRVVPGEGDVRAKLMIIGEAPGEQEEREGRPFVGPSGNVLTQLLADNGITREECWIDNVMQIRPPGNDFGTFFKDKRRLEATPELEAGVQRLHKTIDEVNPEVILCMGAMALRFTCGLIGIELHRGFPERCGNRNVIGTYHPANILRKWSAYPTARMDVGRAKELRDKHGRQIPTPAHTLTYQPSFGQCMTYLDSILSSKAPVAFDIETAMRMIDCIGFSNSDNHALTIPFVQDGGNGSYWSEMQEVMLWEKIREVLESRDVPKIGQNIHYEMFYLKQTRNIEVNNIYLDTMIGFNLLAPSQPKSLDYLATVYTWLPFWGEAPKHLGPERWRYNCMDCLVTKAISEPIITDLKENRHWDFYQKLPHRLIHPLHKMSVRGVRADRDFRNRLRSTYRKRTERLRRAINKVIPPADIEAAQAPIKSLKKAERGIFNPGSDTQLRNLLYDVWKLPKVWEKGTKSPKADEAALRKLIDKDKGKHWKFFAYQLQFNKLDILYNGPLSAELGEDGRIRCSYNIAGTKTGRLSSSAAPDGTGTNLQNQPPAMKAMFLADEGHVMVQADLKQAENRVVAYLAQEPRMIQAFEDGVDIHRRVAAMVFRKAEADISKQERQLGKKIGHASNYGMGVDRLRDICWEEMRIKLTREEARRLLNQYFDSFPRIRMWQLEIQEQLGKNRTLINPLGRRRYFYERWGEDLFKEAYAHLPQSTIVDVMNLGILQLDAAGYDLLLQVHDATNLNQAIQESYDEAFRALAKCLEVKFTINRREIVIPIEISYGPDWANMEVWDG